MIKEAFASFKVDVVGRNKNYTMFVTDFFKSHTSITIGLSNHDDALNHVVGEYYRAYRMLRNRRKRVIAEFTSLSSLTDETAQLLLDDVECSSIKPTETVKALAPDYTKEYEALADIANDYGIFCHPITSHTFAQLNGGSFNGYLVTENATEAMLFFQLIALHGLLTPSRKSLLAKGGFLMNMPTGTAVGYDYLKTSTSRLGVADYIKEFRENNGLLEVFAA